MKRRSTRQDFTNSCKCILHIDTETDDGEENKSFNLLTGKKFKLEVINNIRSRNLISARASYLCMPCYMLFSSGKQTL